MTDPSGVQTPRARLPVWLGVVLVLSLAANAFFVGLVAGGKLTSERWADRLRDRFGVEHSAVPGMHHGLPPELDPRFVVRMLPESARGDARTLLDARGPEIRELFEASLTSRAEAMAAMRADPFDRVRLERAFAESRAADAGARAAVHGLMVDIVAGLTPEERAQIGAGIEARFPHMHDRRDHDRLQRWRDRRRPPPDGEDPEAGN